MSRVPVNSIISHNNNRSLRKQTSMERISILITFIVSITILSAASVNLLPANDQAKKNCFYSVEIETTCAPSAETKDHVSVRFSDSLGNLIIVKHLKNPKSVYGGFKRCAIGMFEAKGPCMRQRVCSLYLKKVGSDDWRPGWVKVLRRDQDGGGHVIFPVSNMFCFRTFVPENVWYGFDYCHSGGGFIPHAADFG